MNNISCFLKYKTHTYEEVAHYSIWSFSRKKLYRRKSSIFFEISAFFDEKRGHI